ncbi:MAG: hypothetical protein ACPHY8_06170 [Patescibacteria group bacterium]
MRNSGVYFKNDLLYSQASIAKKSLSEKCVFFPSNSFNKVPITAFIQACEFFIMMLTKLVVVDFPCVPQTAMSLLLFAISASASGYVWI